MRWGPRKLKRVLERDQPGRSWPAASTMGELLKREELVVARKKRRHTPPYSVPLSHADGPNRVWCADLKGWFRTGDGERMTISDAHSRYLLRCEAVEKTDTARARGILRGGISRVWVAGSDPYRPWSAVCLARGCCPCPRRKISTALKQGKGTLPLHPIPSPKRRKSVRNVPGPKCQGCPRPFTRANNCLETSPISTCWKQAHACLDRPTCLQHGALNPSLPYTNQITTMKEGSQVLA